MSDFNPNSQDAILAKILSNQEAHGEMLKDVRDQALKTNGRVTALEQEKWYVRGVTATIAFVASGLFHLWKSRN